MSGRSDIGTTVLEALGPARAAGVLDAADVHLAAALARLAGVDDVDVALAVALASRAPRFGHVCIDLRTVAALVTAELEPDARQAGPALTWPDPDRWRSVLAGSPLVTAADAPLVLDGDRLYLERFHHLEHLVARLLVDRAAPPGGAPDQQLDPAGPAATLLQGDGADRQRAAVAHALGHRLTVLVGGPGTGKTTTVAALLAELVRTDPTARVALAAPTGKAAARLADAVRGAAAQLDPELADRLVHLEAMTVHRLLGSRAGSRTAFRHHRGDPLPHDVVVVDETSMVSLPLMARLLDAVRPEARVVLVGDPDQLASVEAGAVLADIVGSDHDRSPDHDAAAVADGPAAGAVGGAVGGPVGVAVAGSVVALEVSRRFPSSSPIGALARAIRVGDATTALEVLASGAAAGADAVDGADGSGRVDPPGAGIRWVPLAATDPLAVLAIRGLIEPAADAVVEAAVAGDVDAALAGIDQVRLLCAHRHGPFGVERWNERVEGWLRDAGHRTIGWYAGRPVLVTANDHRSGLFNGDLGVTVARPGGPTAVAFPTASGIRWVPAARLDRVETVHATTIHKSQGSEFDHVVVVLPPATSALASRELLYTAVTRARTAVTVVGDADAVHAAVTRRVERVSGLRDLLRGGLR